MKLRLDHTDCSMPKYSATLAASSSGAIVRRHPSAIARARSFERLVSVATRRHAASFTA